MGENWRCNPNSKYFSNVKEREEKEKGHVLPDDPEKDKQPAAKLAVSDGENRQKKGSTEKLISIKKGPSARGGGAGSKIPEIGERKLRGGGLKKRTETTGRTSRS